MQEAFGYVDPGSGFVFVQNTSFFWGLFLGFLAILFLPLRIFFRSLKKSFRFFIVFAIIIVIAGIITGVMMNRGGDTKKVIILGIDAMDARITQELMDKGRLPNFSYLKTNGTFSLLKTTNPSESVVAWSSFFTGLNPGGHGIFDFIMRDPKDCSPYLTFNEAGSAQTGPKPQIRRKGEPFWNILSKNRIPAYVYFCPNTFPPEKVYGKMFSGMGTPDLLGMVGKFSFYTGKTLSAEDKESRGRIVQVAWDGGVIRTVLYGPKVSANSLVEESSVPLKITLDPEDKEKISIEFQGSRLSLEKGIWSGWHKVSFKIGLFRKVEGIIRFYLRNITPDLELYVSPINFSPQRPLFAISYPADLSRRLTDKTGLFYTQGMPHDTWALSENRIDEKAFLEHADIILAEKKKILDEELKGFKKGVFFFYFETLDAVQHMFWRYLDPKHPLYEENSPYKDTIFQYYEKMDKILGDILKKVDPDTTLIVLSDHGFNSFRRAAHLNRWLMENGFLSLRGKMEEGKEFFEDIDWANTRAYALGFGGIYLNREGRERDGIVREPEAEGLKTQISARLKDWNDPATGERVINDVYFSQDIFSGPYVKDAPDLFVGFNSGFRASWQTALGGVPGTLIEDNRKKWSGDHLIDPKLVPGVVFVNKKIELIDPCITGIASAILDLFGIQKPKEMERGFYFKRS